jgi:hypothetical protein
VGRRRRRDRGQDHADPGSRAAGSVPRGQGRRTGPRG